MYLEERSVIKHRIKFGRSHHASDMKIVTELNFPLFCKRFHFLLRGQRRALWPIPNLQHWISGDGQQMITECAHQCYSSHVSLEHGNLWGERESKVRIHHSLLHSETSLPSFLASTHKSWDPRQWTQSPSAWAQPLSFAHALALEKVREEEGEGGEQEDVRVMSVCNWMSLHTKAMRSVPTNVRRNLAHCQKYSRVKLAKEAPFSSEIYI